MRCAETSLSRAGGTIFLPSLRSLRERAGYSPTELADKAELAAGTIHGLERGASRARIGTAERLAEALQVDVDDLARDEEKRSA